MKELKDIIASNLINLRKSNKLTQLELAEKLNYSDKAISKWERGESIPDVFIIKQLADMYGVSVDYILSDHPLSEKIKQKIKKPTLNNKLIITILSTLGVWLLACIGYITVLFLTHKEYNCWMIWIWALPVCFIVFTVFSGIWGHKQHLFFSITFLVWTLITAIYLQLYRLGFNIWQLYLIGIPLQFATFLSLKFTRKNHEQKIKEEETEPLDL
ncbi:MAG: helix-turn-helix transcriptional regulator [Clostridia bacterium]|nr:helix-turn-helix transcriptional regulator [Clostridia bacterium]